MACKYRQSIGDYVKTVRVQVVQLGIGTVGGEVIEQVLRHRDAWRRNLGIHVSVGAVIGKDGAILAGEPDGFCDQELLESVEARRAGRSLGQGRQPLVDPNIAIEAVAKRSPLIVIDAAAGDARTDLDALALQLGGGVVLSNKAPLALPVSDARSNALWSESGTNGRMRYEATCGAGLPVIASLRTLLDTGDETIQITGSLSGTFGAIFSDVAAGKPFSTAVRDAKANGYTEPDPRDDLSGLDVARKALILARTTGREVNLDDIQVESLVPDHLRDVSVDEFLARITEADDDIGRRAYEAREMGETLKYVATIPAHGPIEVGIRSIPISTVLGALQGPENIVSFRTKRYDAYPLVVTGPGAGAAVTAAGMTGDMLSLAKVIGL
jgi:homoserine dehydrogenase